MFGIGVAVRQRLARKRAQRTEGLAHDQALAAQVRSIADVVLNIGDRLVENEDRRGSFTGADLRSLEAEIERSSGGNDGLVLRALDDPRILAWKQAWADQRNLAGLGVAIRVNYFDGLAMRFRQRVPEAGENTDAG
ncbi:MAG TPA: hypothetical protein VNC60_10795 [Actinomycetota bacterium]|nr:hypothetical protein [Actinomycetota bacterium]